MGESDPTATVITSLVMELVKVGPLAAILFVLLRDQMNKFDKFLAVIDSLREAIAKNSSTIELLTNQCRAVQAGADKEKSLAELRRTLAEEKRESRGGQRDGSE